MLKRIVSQSACVIDYLFLHLQDTFWWFFLEKFQVSTNTYILNKPRNARSWGGGGGGIPKCK